jgi:probable F420-dependent oxidoreductase
MKFGYVLPNFGNKVEAKEVAEIARVCEEVSFDSVWATDHVIMPPELKEPYAQLLEPLVTLSFIAAKTDKLKLGTSIIVLPQRNPIVVAKQATTLDAFSGGRVILGVGAGWAQAEFANLGANFANRGKVFDESLKLIRTLWKEQVVDFKGSFFRVANSLFLPKPVNGTIPVWIGGTSKPAIQRAIRLGDGWHPTGLDLEQFRSGVNSIKLSGKSITISMRMNTDIRKKREAEATSPSGERRTVLSGTREEILKRLEEYRVAGLEYFCASILHPAAAEIIEDIRRFSKEVIQSF